MHRQITNAPDGMQVDHKNGDKLDNRRVNLRICTNTENHRNVGLRSNNTSGYKGIHWCKHLKKWEARIWVNSQYISLGVFANIIDAARAYDEAARKYHGDFANLNGV